MKPLVILKLFKNIKVLLIRNQFCFQTLDTRQRRSQTASLLQQAQHSANVASISITRMGPDRFISVLVPALSGEQWILRFESPESSSALTSMQSCLQSVSPAPRRVSFHSAGLIHPWRDCLHLSSQCWALEEAVSSDTFISLLPETRAKRQECYSQEHAFECPKNYSRRMPTAFIFIKQKKIWRKNDVNKRSQWYPHCSFIFSFISLFNVTLSNQEDFL